MFDSNKVDELLKAENWQLESLQRLGMSREDAIVEFTLGVDYHDVQKFIEEHPSCDAKLACQIVR